jgi:hypothetical protein
MRLGSYILVLSLYGGFASFGSASGAPPCDGLVSVPNRPADAVEPAKERRVTLRFNSEAGAADNDSDLALLAAAVEITESAKQSEGTSASRIIEMKQGFRLWLRDGSVKALADRGGLAIQYQKNSTTIVERLTVTLSGGARWTSDGVDVTADELTIALQPKHQADASAPPMVEWKLRGHAKIVAKRFEASANRVEVESSYETGAPKRQNMRILLEGAATLSGQIFPGGGKSQTQANRIEFNPSRFQLKAE